VSRIDRTTRQRAAAAATRAHHARVAAATDALIELVPPEPRTVLTAALALMRVLVDYECVTPETPDAPPCLSLGSTAGFEALGKPWEAVLDCRVARYLGRGADALEAAWDLHARVRDGIAARIIPGAPNAVQPMLEAALRADDERLARLTRPAGPVGK